MAEKKTDEAKPKTREGQALADSMTRAKTLSGQIWDTTKWLLTFLGAIAPFAFAQQLSQGPVRDQTAPKLVVASLVAVFCAGIAAFIVYALTTTYIQKADETAKKPQKVLVRRNGVLWLLIIAQVILIPLATVMEAGAVYRTLGSHDPDLNLNYRLARRIDFYVGAADQAEVVDSVKEYCKDHLKDNGATTTFLSSCLRFNNTTPPTKENAADMARQLRAEIEARK